MESIEAEDNIIRQNHLGEVTNCYQGLGLGRAADSNPINFNKGKIINYIFAGNNGVVRPGGGDNSIPLK
jgi:hypothetical protein